MEIKWFKPFSFSFAVLLELSSVQVFIIIIRESRPMCLIPRVTQRNQPASFPGSHTSCNICLENAMRRNKAFRKPRNRPAPDKTRVASTSHVGLLGPPHSIPVPSIIASELARIFIKSQLRSSGSGEAITHSAYMLTKVSVDRKKYAQL